jgi:lysine 2,3-aminomutase
VTGKGEFRAASCHDELRRVYRDLLRLRENPDILLKLLWKASPEACRAVLESRDVSSAREAVFRLLMQKERWMLSTECGLNPLEKANAREALRTFRNLVGESCEKKAGCSTLETLREALGGNPGAASRCFMLEMIHLFLAVEGDSGIYPGKAGSPGYKPAFLRFKGRAAALERDGMLDREAGGMHRRMVRYCSGLEPEVVQRRRRHRDRILEFFGAEQGDWKDYRWHLRNVVRDPGTLSALVELPPDSLRAVELACTEGLPFGVTPYYMSLMDPEGQEADHAVRAQVIPTLQGVEAMIAHRRERAEYFDFMGEKNTSPVDLVTRRYPEIAIFKPFNACAQICVYCQRNWELDRVMARGAMAPADRQEAALDWFARHREVREVLITGGDPCVMSDSSLRRIIGRFRAMPHLRRIRVGTRTPVVLPMRWTPSLTEILAEAARPGALEVAVVTHFEHSYEVTPEAAGAVEKIRRAGIGVYNQQVFTLENSRRFESARLRRDLRSIGVDPYYTFNMKGKSETDHMRVPIARILQERKEEARLLPGLDRTDEPVFNVPRLGKNHLRAWQDRRLIMIRQDGRRVYEFHPWEKNLEAVPCFTYDDVPVLEFLERMALRGENPWDYRTIWYYY